MSSVGNPETNLVSKEKANRKKVLFERNENDSMCSTFMQRKKSVRQVNDVFLLLLNRLSKKKLLELHLESFQFFKYINVNNLMKLN